MIDTLKQTRANLSLLWYEWQTEVDDGSWNRPEVDENIRELGEVIERLETPFDAYYDGALILERAGVLYKESERARGSVRVQTITPFDSIDHFVMLATIEFIKGDLKHGS